MTMTKEEIAKNLEHYLELYAIGNNDDYLSGILIYAGMLAAACK